MLLGLKCMSKAESVELMEESCGDVRETLAVRTGTKGKLWSETLAGEDVVLQTVLFSTALPRFGQC